MQKFVSRLCKSKLFIIGTGDGGSGMSVIVNTNKYDDKPIFQLLNSTANIRIL